MHLLRASLLIITVISGKFIAAQIVSSNAFIQGNYVEIGVNYCGAYGTPATPPAGYHYNVFSGIGFTADSDLDGWTTGTPNYCGDYFVPGSPVEGWGIEMNGGWPYYNTDQYCSWNSIPGSITGYSYASGEYIVTWEGDFTTGADLHFTQETILKENETYFVTRVTVCNEDAVDVSDFYYMRNVDPDQDQPWSGDFTTYNEVIYQQPADGQALVTSEGLTYGCFLGLGSKFTDSRVTYGNFSTTSYGPKAVYNGTSFYYQSGSQTGDIANSIAFYFASIPADECVCFSFAYILDAADLDEALDATLPVTFMSGGSPFGTGDTMYVTSGVPVDLSVVPLAGYTYTWSPAAGLSSTTGTSVIATVTTTTTYTVDGTGPNCGDLFGTITLIPILILAPELNYFSAQCNYNAIELKWETENNISKFIVEKSVDGNIFIPVSEIPASGGGYAYTDADTHTGMYYYRLQFIDYNGNTDYSEIISASCENVSAGFEILSAKLKEHLLDITFNTLHNGTYILELFDMNGQQMLDKMIPAEKGVQSVKMPVHEKLFNHYYMITITDRTTGKQIAKKILQQ